MYVFNTFGGVSLTVNIILLLVTGAFVNGPYALITTAVSADLGTHPSKHFLNFFLFKFIPIFIWHD